MSDTQDIVLDLLKETPMLDLGKEFPSLEDLTAVLKWGMHPVFGENLDNGYDLDLFLFCLNSAGKITGASDVVFHNNKSLSGGGIQLPKDNRTGGEEKVLTHLSKIPAAYHTIQIHTFLFEAEKRGQNFGMMIDALFTLMDDTNKLKLQSYRLDKYPNQTHLHVGNLTRTDRGWSFIPIGVADNLNPNQVVTLVR